MSPVFQAGAGGTKECYKSVRTAKVHNGAREESRISRLLERIKRFLSRKPENAYKWLYLIGGCVFMLFAALQFRVWGFSNPVPYAGLSVGLWLVTRWLSTSLPARRRRLIVASRTAELVLMIVALVFLALGTYYVLRLPGSF